MNNPPALHHMSMMSQCRKGYIQPRVNKQQHRLKMILPSRVRGGQSLFQNVPGEQQCTCDGGIAGCQILTNSRHVRFETRKRRQAMKDLRYGFKRHALRKASISKVTHV